MAAEDKRLFAFIFVGAVLRFAFEGFLYYPYLDDYVQYLYYPSREALGEVLFGGAKTVYTRPLAAIADIFVWGAAGQNLALAMIILAAIYGASGIFFYCAFLESKISVSPFFLIFYVFCPINIEGTYWVSASSRIAVSLFFAALSAFALARHNESGKRGAFLLFAAAHFVSYWFYEQTAAVGALLCLLLSIRKKNFLAAAFVLVSAAAFVIWYAALGGKGSNAQRLEAVSFGGLAKNFFAVLREVFYILTKVFGEIMQGGAKNGIREIIKAPIKLILLGSLSALSAFCARVREKSEKEELYFGLLLFFAAFSPFYVMKDAWFNLRNITPALLGLSLVLDFFAARLNFAAFRGVFAASLALFLIVTAAEISDYNRTAAHDFIIVKNLAKEHIKTGQASLYQEASLPEYLIESGIYHDHIVSAAALDWGFSGAVRGLTKNPQITVQPRKEAQ